MAKEKRRVLTEGLMLGQMKGGTPSGKPIRPPPAPMPITGFASVTIEMVGCVSELLLDIDKLLDEEIDKIPLSVDRPQTKAEAKQLLRLQRLKERITVLAQVIE